MSRCISRIFTVSRKKTFSLFSASVAVFFLLFLPYVYVYQGQGWNQNSRLNLLHALTKDRSIIIDKYHENTGDKAFVNGHYYSDKPPGIAFLALPAFYLGSGISAVAGFAPESPKDWNTSGWIATGGSVGLLAALGGASFFALLSGFFSRKFSILATLAVFLGSGIFPYATMLFSHAGTAGLIAIALFCIIDYPVLPKRSARSSRGFLRDVLENPSGRDVVAGVCLGFAIASEYTVAIAAGTILLFAISQKISRGVWIVLGACFPVMLIPLYNMLTVGSPFDLGYGHVQGFPDMQEGFYGIHFLPDPKAIFHLLFTPAKGLFFWSPFLLLAIPGYAVLFRRSRPLFFLFFLVPILHILLISSFFLPSGGWGLGPRYFVAIVPFIGFAAAFGASVFRRTAFVAGTLSVLLTGTATLIAAVTPEVENPLVTFYLPRLADAHLMQNIGTKIGLSPVISIAALVLLMLLMFAGTWKMPDTSSSRMSKARFR